MKVLDVLWFTAAQGTVGIVKVDTDFDGVVYYIGPAKGDDAKDDATTIANWGARFPTRAGDILFGA